MARPNKLILIVEKDPDTLAMTMLALSCNRFRVVGTYTVGEAAAYIGDGCVADAVLLNTVTHDMPYEIRGTPCLARKREWNFAEVVMFLRIMCQRKRGPKKGWRRVVPVDSASVQNLA